MKKVHLFISVLVIGIVVVVYACVDMPNFAYEPISQPPISSVSDTSVFVSDSSSFVSDSSIFVFIEHLEFPATKSGDDIISHIGYSFLYNEAHEQSDWVAYLLTAERTVSVVKRKDHFRADPAVKTGTAVTADYTGSGYDRGHLAPCADMCWSAEAMDESFFFSNMSPQVPNFNQVTWEKLEELVRTWAKEYDTLYIATGPVLRKGLPSIEDMLSQSNKEKYKAKNRVSVPQYYYKVILCYNSKDIKGIGFIMPNEKGLDQTLQKYAVTIDSVQNFTGINFFHQLSKAQEECAEKTLCLPCWTWGKNDVIIK
jgi:endonuclease G